MGTRCPGLSPGHPFPPQMWSQFQDIDFLVDGNGGHLFFNFCAAGGEGTEALGEARVQRREGAEEVAKCGGRRTAVGFALEERWQMALTPEIKEKDERNRHQNRGG